MFHRGGGHVTKCPSILCTYCVVVYQQGIGAVVVKLTSTKKPQQKRIIRPRLQPYGLYVQLLVNGQQEFKASIFNTFEDKTSGP